MLDETSMPNDFGGEEKGGKNKSFLIVPPNYLAIEVLMSLRIVEKEIFLF